MILLRNKWSLKVQCHYVCILLNASNLLTLNRNFLCIHWSGNVWNVLLTSLQINPFMCISQCCTCLLRNNWIVYLCFTSFSENCQSLNVFFRSTRILSLSQGQKTTKLFTMKTFLQLKRKIYNLILNQEQEYNQKMKESLR